MKTIRKQLLCAATLLVLLLTPAARAGSGPDPDSPPPPDPDQDGSYTYTVPMILIPPQRNDAPHDATADNDEDDSFITIFDVQGYVAGSAAGPTDWIVTTLMSGPTPSRGCRG